MRFSVRRRVGLWGDGFNRQQKAVKSHHAVNQMKKETKMKKTVAVAALAAVAAAATLSYAGGPARTGVNGSLHDMNYYAVNTMAEYNSSVPHVGQMKQDVYNRVCVFCHTPHNATVADSSMNPLPLWGNTVSDLQPTPYQWATPANKSLTRDNTDVLAGPSRLCMTCHDGSIAIDAHTSNGTDNNGTFTLSGSRAVGSNGSLIEKTHPIGFSWDAAVKARNIKTGDLINGVAATNDVNEIAQKNEQFATSVTHSGAAGTYNTVARNSGRTIGSVLYEGDIMTCASCHEVHNKENAVQDPAVKNAAGVAVAATPNYFLYAKESESLICLSCHIK